MNNPDDIVGARDLSVSRVGSQSVGVDEVKTNPVFQNMLSAAKHDGTLIITPVTYTLE